MAGAPDPERTGAIANGSAVLPKRCVDVFISSLIDRGTTKDVAWTDKVVALNQVFKLNGAYYNSCSISYILKKPGPAWLELPQHLPPLQPNVQKAKELAAQKLPIVVELGICGIRSSGSTPYDLDTSHDVRFLSNPGSSWTTGQNCTECVGGMQMADINRSFKVGRATVTAVDEWTAGVVSFSEFFTPYDQALFEARRDLLPPGYSRSERGIVPKIQNWLIQVDGRKVVVDTGFGNGKTLPGLPPEFSNLNTTFLENFRREGVQPDEVEMVLLTHLHIDHVGWNTTREGHSWRPTFSNARHVFSLVERHYWDTTSAHYKPTDTGRHIMQNCFEESVLPILKEGLGQRLRWMHASTIYSVLCPRQAIRPARLPSSLNATAKVCFSLGTPCITPCR